MEMGDEGLFYPKMASLTDGQLTDRQLEEELDRGRIYRLNDRFFKFLFGREDRKTLFLDLVNALIGCHPPHHREEVTPYVIIRETRLHGSSPV